MMPANTLHVDDFLARVRHPSQTPTSDEIQTLLNELQSIAISDVDDNTRELLKGVHHRLQAMHLFLSSDESSALRELKEARRVFESSNSTVDLARVSLLEGNCHLALGQFSEALSHYERAADLFHELGESNGKARATGNKGNVYNYIGNYPLALHNYREAIAIHEVDGDLDGLARTVGGMGLVYANLTEYPDALQHLTRSLEIHRSLGAKREEARLLSSLGNVYRQIADYPKAVEHFQKAQAIIEDVGEKSGLARVLSNLAGIYSDMHDYARSLEYNKRALAINEKTKDASTHARIVGEVASALHSLDKHESALEFIEKAMNESMKLGLTSLHCGQSLVRATILYKLGRVDEAQSAAELCLNESTRLGDLTDTIQACITIGLCHDARGERVEARALYERALADSHSCGVRYIESTILATLSKLLEQSEPRTALEYYRQSVAIDKQILGEQQQRQLAMLDMEQKLSEEHKLHEQHRELLLQLMPDATVVRILNGEKIIADTYENASVMFLDIVGFTSLASQAPASHLVHLLNAVFERCDAVCDQFDLSKIKTIGDSYLAISGMPALQEDHAHRIASAALALVRELRRLHVTIPSELGNADWVKDVGDLEVRIGLHCGPVVAGVIGKKRAQYDVWGDTVNVASRMESTSHAGKIQVSDAFAHVLAGNGAPVLDGADVIIRNAPFLLRLRGTIDIKGKGEMKTWWLELIAP
ncbi:MAG: tetratricopeptide repeat protein [Candidatus Kapabacteria bacterium]|nr:tetratricopeptide repeat protein [Candidatus Kapabacteria bacterium]